MKKLILLLILLSAQISLATTLTPLDNALLRARQENWSQDRQWHLLLHYRPSILGEKSQADGAKFFLSPAGATRADLELEALIKEFFQPQRMITSQDGKFSEPAACVFPARFMYLAKKLGQPAPVIECNRFKRFQEILSAQSVTYVFSSYYLNNPASGFGHTFLRLNKAASARTGERYQLADYGIGYAAVMVSENPMVYSVLGILGLMPGAFDVNPYYFKVREYNDFESRDIWEYDLALTPDEVQMLVAHLWELSDVPFDYYYFSENCSYRMLAVLEVARPSLNLVDKLKTQVMPADTVAIVADAPGLLKEVQYRPSNRVIFLSRFDSLPSNLQNRVREFSLDEDLKKLTLGLSNQEQRDILDAAIDYVDYHYATQILKKEGKYSFKKDILAARAEVGGISPDLKISAPTEEAPHVAHGSRRLGLGYRSSQGEDVSLLAVKLSLHDLLDPKIGYPPTAQITMGEGVLSYNSQARETALDRFTLFEVVSLAPWSDFTKNNSWRLKLASERAYDSDCLGLCRQSELTGGIGHTRAFGNFEVTAWLRGGVIQSNDFIGENYSLTLGPAVQFRYHWKSLSFLTEGYYRYGTKTETHERRILQGGFQWSPQKNWGLRVSGDMQNEFHHTDFMLHYYY